MEKTRQDGRVRVRVRVRVRPGLVAIECGRKR
jgi:hypothetical protein